MLLRLRDAGQQANRPAWQPFFSCLSSLPPQHWSCVRSRPRPS